MHDILRNISHEKPKKRAWLYAIILSVYITLCMTLGSAGDVDTDIMTKINPISWLLFQGFFSIIIFIVFGFLFAKLTLGINLSHFFPSFSLEHLGLALFITVCFMVVNSGIVEWNMSLDFPNSDFEAWARRSEEQRRILTEHITSFASLKHFMLAMLVIAVITSIGEELLFRGLIQNFFFRAMNNHHVAIWVTGFLFSAIHLQFYGLVPRWFLSVLFGYIYHWSGKLSLAVMAHFLNNGLSLLVLYLVQNHILDISPEQMETAAPWPAIILSGLLGGVLLKRFYFKTKRQNE